MLEYVAIFTEITLQYIKNSLNFELKILVWLWTIVSFIKTESTKKFNLYLEILVCGFGQLLVL
jgi:hypothetical protein